jgi:hypothetical protein
VFTLGMMAGGALWGWPIDGFFFDGAWMLFAGGVLVYWTLHYGTPRARWWAGTILVVSAIIVPAGPAGSSVAFVFAALLLVLYPLDYGADEGIVDAAAQFLRADVLLALSRARA